MATAYPTMPAQVVTEIARRFGVLVKATLDHEFGDRIQCNHCAMVDALTSVRVYGDPAERHQLPIRLVEVCTPCAPTVIDEAISQQREWSHHPIRVEVAA